jgi:hypothetical protein
MPKEKGPLLNCLEKTKHHVAPHKAGLLIAGGVSVEQLRGRFALIHGEVETAIQQIEKLQNIAVEKGYADILAILNEAVEFGHDIPAVAAK